MITYYFPPRPGIASLRLRGLAKYLPEFGWDVVVLTPELPDMPEPRYDVVQTDYPGEATDVWKKRFGLGTDKRLQDQVGIPRAISESKYSPVLKAINLLRAVIAFPDEQRGWLRPATQAGMRLLAENRFDAIISSHRPPTCHRIAKALKERHDVPWIADFRDLWTQDHFFPYVTRVRAIRTMERRLEIKTLENADALVTVSEPLAEELRSLHRGKKVVSIPNGFDPDEVVPAPLTEKFTITYTGLTYLGKRDPSPLLRAVSELVAERKLDRQSISIRFYGTIEYWLEREIERLGLDDVVALYPQVPRAVALDRQRESQVLLLLNWDHPGEVGVYTGKLFEYLAARRPILAIGKPGGVVDELLRETGAGIYPPGYEQLKGVLEDLYNQYRALGYVPFTGIEEKIARYSHKEMARRFAALMDELSHGRSRAQD
ncbi:MAG: glycosyltransferase family 4 protein [Actinobacteria bacterium]|nr:glycosyltransferase family 4 protein [Actinomycetota bacterium]